MLVPWAAVWRVTQGIPAAALSRIFVLIEKRGIYGKTTPSKKNIGAKYCAVVQLRE
jgi:hypothetical protein